jgi:hypothetical protein
MFVSNTWLTTRISFGRIVDADYRIEMTSHRLKNLGWKPRKLEETLSDSVESYEEAGFLQVSEPCRLPSVFGRNGGGSNGRRQEQDQGRS